jgi:hypothetical protein
MKTKTIFYQVLILLFFVSPFVLRAQQTDTVKVELMKFLFNDNIAKIDANGTFTLIIEQGDEQSIAFEKSISESVHYKLKDNVLSINADGGKVLLRIKTIEEIKSSDVTTIKTNSAIKCTNLKVVLNDASNQQLIVDAENLTANTNDASKLIVKGKALNFTIVADDASRIKAPMFEVTNVKATTNDAAAIWVNAKETIEGKTNDVSRLNYFDGVKNVNIESNDISKAKKYSDKSIDDNDEDVHFPADSIQNIVTDILIQVDSTIINNKDGNDKHKWSSKFMNKSNRFNGNWAGLMIGLNNFVDATGKFEVPVGYEYLDLDVVGSKTVALNLFEYNIPLICNKFGITTGLGFQWYNYRFAKNAILDANQTVISGGFDSSNTYQKSKLTYTMLNIPLLLEFQTNPKHNRHSFHINGGIIFGVKLGAHTKTIIDNGADIKIRVSDDFNLNPIRLDATAGIGYGIINLFASYSLTTLFKDKEGPSLYPVTAGINILLW